MRVTIDDGYHAYRRALRPAGRVARPHDGRAPARPPREVTMLRDAMITFRYQMHHRRAPVRRRRADAVTPASRLGLLLGRVLRDTLVLLSGILLPMSLAPAWLQRLAAVNPFSHIVEGARAAFRDDLGDASLRIGLVASALLAVLGLVVATRTVQRESA